MPLFLDVPHAAKPSSESFQEAKQDIAKQRRFIAKLPMVPLLKGTQSREFFVGLPVHLSLSLSLCASGDPHDQEQVEVRRPALRKRRAWICMASRTACQCLSSISWMI